MSSRDYMIDATTRNAVFLQRKAGGDVNAILQMMDSLERSILGAVASDYGTLRQQALALEIANMAAESYQEIGLAIGSRAQETAEYMAGFEARLLETGVRAAAIAAPSVTRDAVMGAVFNARPGVSPLTIQQAISGYGDIKSAEARTVLTDAVLGNKSSSEATKDLSALFKIQRRQAETLVRTTMNSAAQTGRMATLAANSELIEGYEWVAKLDARTTLVCAGRDGQVYKLGSGPVPPAHYGCRSQIVPALLPQYNRADLAGDAAEEETYGAWLRKQPAAFQDEALGDTRAALFRRGDLQIGKFTDDAGRTYTIDELRELEPLAFERANLDE